MLLLVELERYKWGGKNISKNSDPKSRRDAEDVGTLHFQFRF